MKKRQKVILHSLLIGLMVPYAAYAQDEGVPQVEVPETSSMQLPEDALPAKSRWQRATQAIREKLPSTQDLREKLPTVQELKEKLPLIKDKLAQARSFLKQKSYCLFKYSACTKRDKLLISNYFGFLAGYGSQYRSLFERILKKGGYSRIRVGDIFGYEVTVVEIVQILSIIAGFSGPLLVEPQEFLMLPGLIRGYMVAPNKTSWIRSMKNFLNQKKLFLIFIALDAISVLSEAAFALTYDGKLPFRSIASYLKMNAKCIWSESNCKPEKNAEARRNGLYFWLGFLEGALLYQLEIRTWRRPAPFAPPAPPPAPFIFPSYLPASSRER